MGGYRKKEFIMEVSSSTAPTVGLPEGKSPMQKATEVQGQQVMKILETIDAGLKAAVITRGYGRKTKGLYVADEKSGFKCL